MPDEHIQKIEELIIKYDTHTKIVEAETKEMKKDIKDLVNCINGDMNSKTPGLKTLVMMHQNWFKWIGGLLTGLIAWLLKTELFG